MRMSLIAAVVGLGLLSAACTIDVEPNPDGSLTVESQIDEEKLSDAIAANAKPDESLDVEFHDGFIAIDGTGPDPDTGRLNVVSFEATLSVEDGHLAADLYEAYWNGEPMPNWIVEFWNNALSRALERAGDKDPDNTLLSVDVSESSITLVWRVETDASRS